MSERKKNTRGNRFEGKYRTHVYDHTVHKKTFRFASFYDFEKYLELLLLTVINELFLFFFFFAPFLPFSHL